MPYSNATTTQIDEPSIGNDVATRGA
ncbi:hypothetical protein PSEUDO9AG_30249 [Pseudomonas sp. 9Ag]|nr:hypothetical protein PSEUDO9AG_30249 [Pseudomonas sp. 9Ag]